MSLDILHRYTKAILYSSATATTIAETVTEAHKSGANLSDANLSRVNLYGANLSDANLSRADLYGAKLYDANLSRANLSRADLYGAKLYDANLSRANLYGANLYGANLYGAKLSHANLSHADLSRANLYGANLSGADLYGANLSGTNLSRANGIQPEKCTPLLMLLDQPGPIRGYKLVNNKGQGPFAAGNGHSPITYQVADRYEVLDASTDPTIECASGISVATLDWCLKNWREGYRVLVVEFTAKDIASIPTGTDGKFRLFRCQVVGEKDITALVANPVEVSA